MTIPTLKRMIVFEPNTNIYLTQYVSITPKSDNIYVYICIYIYIHIYYTSYICMYIYIMKDEYTYARRHLYILIYTNT